MDLFVATIFGFIAGLFIGILPGLGTTSFLIMCSPFLIEQSLLFCVLFYSVASSVSQYFGSITTLSFGVPGENTSLPLFGIRNKIIEENKLGEVYFLCAFGSLFASLFTGIILFFTIDLYNNVLYLKSYVSLVCGVLGLILCLFYSSNKIVVSFILILCGWFLSKIGYDNITNTSFLTFDNPYLYSGLPFIPVIMGIYAIPNLIQMLFETEKLSSQNIEIKYKFNKINLILENLIIVFRSTVIGFISGLIPYVGNGISSLVAFSVEKKMKPDNVIAQSTASESANNSANLSVLIPLLILGVAIVPSEFVLLEILMSSNQYISWESISKNYMSIVFFLFLANILAFYTSWYSIELVNKIALKMKKALPVLLIILIFVGIWYFGNQYSQDKYYLIVLICFTFFGLIFYKYDFLPFSYAFLLQNNIEQIFYRIYQIYFL